MRKSIIIILILITNWCSAQKTLLVGANGIYDRELISQGVFKYSGNYIGIVGEYKFNKTISLNIGIGVKNHILRIDFNRLRTHDLNDPYLISQNNRIRTTYFSIPILARIYIKKFYFNGGFSLDFFLNQNSSLLPHGSPKNKFASDAIFGVGYSYPIKKLILYAEGRYFLPLHTLSIDDTRGLFGINIGISMKIYEKAKSVKAKKKSTMTRKQAIAKLKEYKELLDLGVITKEEYEQHKIELTKIINETN